MKEPTLGNPQNTIEVLQKYNFVFQKKFGQNFLIDTHVLDKIIAAAEITKDDFVLEIGPGIGTMTQYLACAARKVVAVEIDKALIPILEDTLSDYDNARVINNDVLKVDIAKLAEEENGGNRSRLWPTCHITLQRRSLWDFLRIMSPFLLSPLWCRRKLRTECRLDQERRIMAHCRWLYSIMRSPRLLPMFRRTVLCQDQRWEAL